MTYKTRQSYLGYCLSIALCFAGANCGDPATGTWINMTLPTPPVGMPQQFTSYMSTLTFGDALSVTVDLEAVRTPGAITYSSCAESLMGTGTYTEMAGVITSTFTAGTNTRTGCMYAADNIAAMPIDDPAKANLVSLSSGNFTIAAGVLTFTMAGATLKYMKMM